MLASSKNILTVFNRLINKNSFTIPVKINEKNVETETLINSEAGGKCIDQNYMRTMQLVEVFAARTIDSKSQLLISKLFIKVMYLEK